MRLLFATLIVAFFCCAQSARADDALGQPLADSLFKAGRELMEATRYEEACQKFEESYRLDASAGTLLNLGLCFEARGKTATAWSLYKRTITLGKTSNKPRHVSAAEEFIAAIDPKLARLVVTVEKPVPGLRVMCGDLEIGEATRGLPVPVDPGRYAVVAEAPGYESFKTDVVASESKTEAVTVPVLAKKATRLPPPPPVPVERGPAPLFIVGLTAAGLGLASLSVGTAFGVMTLDNASAAENDSALCPAHKCSAAGLAFIEDAQTKATVSTATLVAGGVLLAGGAALVTIAVVERGGFANVAFMPRAFAGTMLVGFDMVGSW